MKYCKKLFALLAAALLCMALTLPAGEYQVRLTLPGTVDVVYDSGPLPLNAGADLLIAAIDNLGAGPSPVKLLAIDSTGATPLSCLWMSRPS